MRFRLALYIGLRYTRAKRRQRFVSFIALISMLGIALGVAVLITVLSVFNGFDQQIRQQFFSMAAEVSLFFPPASTVDTQKITAQVGKLPMVVDSAPVATGQGMLTANGQMQAAYVLGIDPKLQGKVSNLPQKIVSGQLSSIAPGKFNMVIGQGLASSLNLAVGNKLTLLTPQASLTPLGVMPRYKRFTITGIFHASTGFGFDSSLVFINYHDAKVLFSGTQAHAGIRLKLQNPYDALAVTDQLQRMFPFPYQVTNWSDSYGAFFKALAMEKTMMLIVLTLIIAVAAFNLVSSLMMTVNDKRADIAILRTLGATGGLIRATFMVQGVLVGMMGCVCGIVLGIIMALNATAFVNWLQQVLHMQLVSSAIYFVNYLPSKLQWTDVVQVASIALVLSVLATIYPAWSAGKTQPAEALRYE